MEAEARVLSQIVHLQRFSRRAREKNLHSECRSQFLQRYLTQQAALYDCFCSYQIICPFILLNAAVIGL